MNHTKPSLLKIGMLCVVCLLGFTARALDGVVVIANEGVSSSSLTAEALKNIYTGKTKYWEDGQAIIIVVLPDQTDAALEETCGMDSSSFKTFWQRLAFSGRGEMPKKANDASSLVSMVASTKGAIALAPANGALGGVKKINVK